MHPELDALITEKNLSDKDVTYNAKYATALKNSRGLQALLTIEEQIGGEANRDYVMNTRSHPLKYELAEVMLKSPFVVSRMSVQMCKEYPIFALVDGSRPVLDIKPYVDEIVNSPYDDKIGEFLVTNMTIPEMVKTLDVVHELDEEKSNVITHDILHSSDMDRHSLHEFLGHLDANTKQDLISDLGGSYSEIDDVLLSEIIAFNNSNVSPSTFNFVDFQRVVPLAATQNIDAYKLHTPDELRKTTSLSDMKTILNKYPTDSSLGQRVKSFLASKPDEYFVNEVVNSCIKSENNDLKLVAIESYLYDETPYDRAVLIPALQSLDNLWDSSDAVRKSGELVSIYRESFDTPINWGSDGYDIDVVTKVYVDKLDELIDWRSDTLESMKMFN